MDCPVCNRTDVSERICPRCGSDLDHLWKVDRAQRYLLARGRRLLREENFPEALRYFRRAYGLARTEPARRGIIVAGICASVISGAARQDVVIASHGRPVAGLTGFADEDEDIEYRPLKDPRFQAIVRQSGQEARDGKVTPLDDLE